jgi:hypothetical protein
LKFFTVVKIEIEVFWIVTQGAEDNTWTYGGGNGGKLEKTTLNKELHNLHASTNIIRVIK